MMLNAQVEHMNDERQMMRALTKHSNAATFLNQLRNVEFIILEIDDE